MVSINTEPDQWQKPKEKKMNTLYLKNYNKMHTLSVRSAVFEARIIPARKKNTGLVTDAKLKHHVSTMPLISSPTGTIQFKCPKLGI